MHDSEPYAECFTLLHVYLDHLHTIFLLQRSVVKQTNSGHDALFSTSRLVLSIITRISADRDPVMDMTRHYAWIVGFPFFFFLAHFASYRPTGTDHGVKNDRRSTTDFPAPAS